MEIEKVIELTIYTPDLKSYIIHKRNIWRDIINNENHESINSLAQNSGVLFDNNFPIRYAAFRGKFNIVKQLISLGSQINIYFDRNEACFCDRELGHALPLTYCVAHGNIDLVKFFVESGVDFHLDDEQALFYAVDVKNFEIVKYLLQNGAKIDFKTNFGKKNLFRSAIEVNFLELICYLIDLGDNLTPKAVIDKTNYANHFTFTQSDSEGNETIRYLLDNNHIGLTDLPNELAIKYKRLFYYTTVKKPVGDQDICCLITHLPIAYGDEYLICSNKDEHIYQKTAIDQWNKLECLLCKVDLEEDVFINSN